MARIASGLMKKASSLSDNLADLGAEVVEGKIKKAASSKADDAIKLTRKKQQALYDNLFNEDSTARVFDRSKIISQKNVLDNKAVNKEIRRMDKEYSNAYNLAKKKGFLPNVETANGSRSMNQTEYSKFLNTKEIRNGISEKRIVEQAERNIIRTESTNKQLQSIEKYGGKNRSKTIEEMQARQAKATQNISNNTQNTRIEKTNKNKDEARKLLTKSNIQKGVGLGVGGYLVLNMFDKGGQMSNSELYGQQQQYGSY